MKRLLRILHVLNSSGGGATLCALDLVRSLPRDRYLLSLVVPSEPEAMQRNVLHSLGVDWRVVPMGWWNHKIRLSWSRQIVWGMLDNIRTWGNLRSIYGISQCIRAWQIDIVHTHTGLIPWGALAARGSGVPHIWHIHEPDGAKKPFRYWLPDAWWAYLVERWSDYIVLVSHYVGDIFYRYSYGTPISVVYQGVDIERFSNSEAGKALRASLRIAENHVLVGMVAALTSTWKQHDLFVKMAARLRTKTPEARFVVFGHIPQKPTKWLYNSSYEYAMHIQRLVAEHGLSDRFIWAGFHSDVSAIMNAIDILVHPCDVEGFGRVAIEAMAARRPVVGPNRGGIAETVVNGKTGFLVPAGDIAAFADATEQLVVNDGVRQRVGAAGREHVAANFSLEQHAKQIAEIYEQVYSTRRNRLAARDTGD